VGASVDRLCRVIRHNAATLRVVRYDPRLAELAVWAALLQCPQLEGPVDFVGEWHKMGSADHRCLYRLASQLADSCRRVTDLAVTMLHITVDTLRKLMCAGKPHTHTHTYTHTYIHAREHTRTRRSVGSQAHRCERASDLSDVSPPPPPPPNQNQGCRFETCGSTTGFR
jgi:hypothetical protein